MRFQKPIIYCIGDSHVEFFNYFNSFLNPAIPYFKWHTKHGATAYNLQRQISTTKSRHKLFGAISRLRPGDRIILSYGEVDCRVHLPKQSAKQNRSADDLIKECLNEYFKTITKVKDMGFEIILLGVMPSDIHENPAKEIVKNKIAEKFNNLLEERGKSLGIKTICIFDKLINSRYFSKTRYFKDFAHVSHKAVPFMLKELENKKIIRPVNKFLFYLEYGLLILRQDIASLHFIFNLSKVLKKKFKFYRENLPKLKGFMRIK